MRLSLRRRDPAAELLEDLAAVEALVHALPIGGTAQPDGAPDSAPLAVALEVLRQSVMSLLTAERRPAEECHSQRTRSPKMAPRPRDYRSLAAFGGFAR